MLLSTQTTNDARNEGTQTVDWMSRPISSRIMWTDRIEFDHQRCKQTHKWYNCFKMATKLFINYLPCGIFYKLYIQIILWIACARQNTSGRACMKIWVVNWKNIRVNNTPLSGGVWHAGMHLSKVDLFLRFIWPYMQLLWAFSIQGSFEKLYCKIVILFYNVYIKKYFLKLHKKITKNEIQWP